MGNEIISGSGMNVPGLDDNRKKGIGFAVGLILLGFLLAEIFGVEQSTWRGATRTGLYYFFVISGFIEAAVAIFIFRARNSTIQKTHISVYENEVTGTGVRPEFATDFFSPEKYATSTFSLTFDAYH